MTKKYFIIRRKKDGLYWSGYYETASSRSIPWTWVEDMSRAQGHDTKEEAVSEAHALSNQIKDNRLPGGSVLEIVEVVADFNIVSAGGK